MLDLHNPELDWVKLASGMGVEASHAMSVGEFAGQFGSAMKNRGPRVIEVVLWSCASRSASRGFSILPPTAVAKFDSVTIDILLEALSLHNARLSAVEA